MPRISAQTALRSSAYVLLLIGTLALAACGGSTTSTNASGGSGGSGKGDSSGGSGGGKIKVGLVADQGGLDDRSFNSLANQGLQQTEKDLGDKMQGDVLESKSSSDYQPNLTTFVSRKYDLIIAIGFLMANDVQTVAQQAGNTHFAIVDFSYEKKLPNVRSLVFKEQEAGYLAGALAGMVEEDGKLKGLNAKHVVSSVGGQKIPPVDRYIAGFEAGVKAFCKDCKVTHAYSQDFIAQDKCKSQALTQISQGSDIIFQVAGGCGLGALDAAKQKGVWGIGVDSDQSYLGSHILTSALKKVDVAVADVIKSISEGNFQGGADGVYGLAQNGVGLGKIAPAAAAYEAKLKPVIADINSGKIKIPDTVK